MHFSPFGFEGRMWNLILFLFFIIATPFTFLNRFKLQVIKECTISLRTKIEKIK